MGDNENIEDLELAGTEGEEVVGGGAYPPKPVTPVAGPVLNTAKGAANDVIRDVTPVSGGPTH